MICSLVVASSCYYGSQAPSSRVLDVVIKQAATEWLDYGSHCSTARIRRQERPVNRNCGLCLLNDMGLPI